MTGSPAPQPVLDTERLRLRPFAGRDAAAVQRLAGDFAVADTTLAIPHPYELADARRWIASLPEAYERREQVVFAIDERDGATLCGAVGLILRLEHRRAELGYWVGRPFWGRGYATEAGRAVLRYAFEVLELRRVHAGHFARNPASGRVLIKLGMRCEGTARAHLRRWERFEDLVCYGLLREEFETP